MNTITFGGGASADPLKNGAEEKSFRRGGWNDKVSRQLCFVPAQILDSNICGSSNTATCNAQCADLKTIRHLPLEIGNERPKLAFLNVIKWIIAVDVWFFNT